MQNIVIACDTYMPKASPNGICVREVAVVLKENACRVQIVTTQNMVGQAERDMIDDIPIFRDRKSTRLNSSHSRRSRMPSSA